MELVMVQVREVEEGIYWIQECSVKDQITDELSKDPPEWYLPGKKIHIPNNAFLFTGEENLLFDTLSPAASEEILPALESILDGDDLDYVVPSHPEPVHAANTFKILRRYPTASLVAPVGNPDEIVAPTYGKGHDLYYLDDSKTVFTGETIDLGGLTIEFKEATFPDVAFSIWIYEHTFDMLFTVDWLGIPHSEGECTKCVDEITTEVTQDRFHEFHARALYWFEYADTETTSAAIDRLINEIDPSMVVSAHGLVFRENPAKYMRMMKPVINRISVEGRLGLFNAETSIES